MLFFFLHVVLPLVVLGSFFVFRKRIDNLLRYSPPHPGPSGQTVRYDYKTETLQVWNEACQKWEDA
jgi:hypothetical protein